jgi:hypothetical protein
MTDAEQIVGPERRQRLSHQTWCGEGWMVTRRPVNSDVMPRRFLKSANGLGYDVSTKWSPSRATDDGFVEIKYCGRALWPDVEWFGATHSGGA